MHILPFDFDYFHLTEPDQYSKRGRIFILPNVATGHEVILPVSQMQWFLDQPDNVLNQHEVNKRFLAAEYTMLHPSNVTKGRLLNLVRRNLTRNIGTYAPAIADEAYHALKDTWGVGSFQWTEISLNNTMLAIIGRLVGRVFAGLHFCRDQGYLYHSTRFAQFCAVFQRNLTPQRTESRNHNNAPDFIDWALADIKDPKERTPEMVTKRLAVVNFAAIQSSATTVTNVLLDIAASPDSIAIQKELRLEAQQALNVSKANGGAWSTSTINKMVLIDSTLRESLRLWSFVSHGVTKTVLTLGGIRLPSGDHLPYGAHCGIASYGPQHDEDVYENPYSFQPFRFCEGKQRKAIKAPQADDEVVPGQSAPKSFVTTSEYMMGFNHGRHACPGRFFAAQQTKLLLPHIVLNYDIKPIPTRPQNRWLNNSSGPPMSATLRIRRREVDGTGGRESEKDC
ncbi:hypothetical protein AJ79_06200 [Helicocarpus griseus UAMH5409]|uniref:Cytochrome P450 n=1 Tax=Helicocarpus griseus UAMH5409 TaxID=1447875 RepID=A0A2B7XG40_9EURO|nr:hypothetical protein AJ79_06200 [Helicocarpus griseus UAMH5409]